MGKNLAVIFNFLCVFCPKNDDSDPVNRIEIYGRDIKDFFYDKNENKLYQYVEKWYEVNTNHKVTIILVDYNDSTQLSCSADESKIYKGEYNHGSSPFVTISHNDIYTGIWSCELWNANKQLNMEIFFRLRVKEMMPPQQILVNHIDLNLEKENDIYTAKYYYQDGETVDVDCISSNVSCTVRMNDLFNVIDVNDNTSAWGFGFSTKLKSTHNRKKIKCISDCTGTESIVEVTFFLQEKQRANKINVKINNQDITQNMMPMDYEYNVNYAYFNNSEYVTIRCDTKDNENNIFLSCNHCIYNKTEKIPRDLKSTEVTLMPNMCSIFKCNVDDKIVTIRFQLVSCRNDSQLIVQGLVRDNILSEHHAYRHSQGIFYINYTYEYDNSNSFELSCVVNFKGNLNHRTQNITLETSEKNISSNQSLSIKPNEKPVMCLLQNSSNEIVAKIWISFRLKSQLVMTSSTEGNKVPIKSSTEEPNSTVIAIDESVDHTDHESNNNGDDHNEEGQPQYELWIPAIVVPILFIVVCVVVVMYKMKIRNCLKRREPEHTYDYCMVNAVTQNHPAQNETEYAVPEGVMQENTLYIHTKDFYAQAIPKSQRQRNSNKQQSINAETNKTKVFEEDAGSDFLIMNSLYSRACLEHNDRSEPTKSVGESQETSRQASTNLEMLRDIYSEPINKKEKEEGTYTNVTDEPHYSNKIGGYCVYPTYSEPHIKK